MQTAAIPRLTLLIAVSTVLIICFGRSSSGIPQLRNNRTLSESSSGSETRESTDSLSQEYWRALSLLSTPKLEERKQLLRSCQQRGYANTLAEVLRSDGLGALLAFLRTRLQIEYSISHELVMVDISAKLQLPPDSNNFLPRNKQTIVLPTRPNQPMRIGLGLDWEFPEDPWRRE